MKNIGNLALITALIVFGAVLFGFMYFATHQEVVPPPPSEAMLREPAPTAIIPKTVRKNTALGDRIKGRVYSVAIVSKRLMDVSVFIDETETKILTQVLFAELSNPTLDGVASTHEQIAKAWIASVEGGTLMRVELQTAHEKYNAVVRADFTTEKPK